MSTSDCKNNCGMIGIVRSCSRTGASEPVYLCWAGVGEVRPPPEPLVLALRYAIQHRPSITELIQPKVKWLTWIKTIWTLVHVYEYLSRGSLLGSDWYFLFFIPPCHCYLWSTQWGCHATQSVVPAELWSVLSTSATVTPFKHLQISTKRPQTYLPENYDYHYVHRYYTYVYIHRYHYGLRITSMYSNT